MGAVDTQLEPGEQVLFRTGLHPMAFTGALTLALFVALVVMLLIRHNDLPRPTEIQIALVGLAVAAIGAIPSLLRWRNTELAVTEHRVLVSAGGFRRRRLAVPLAPAAIEQEGGLTGGMLDHGTVTVATPDGRASSIGHVARARELVEVARAQARRPPRRRGNGPG
jgi:membrane protein YdbS with pleckstrin-like domain